MNAAFGADRERRESRLEANRIRHVLVDGHISLGPILRLGLQHAGKERMHREVPAADAVVEPAIHSHVLANVPQWLQESRLLVVTAHLGGKQLLGLVAKQVTNGNEAARAHACTFGRLHGGVAAHVFGQKGGQPWQRQASTEGAKEKTATSHGLGDVFEGTVRTIRMPSFCSNQ